MVMILNSGEVSKKHQTTMSKFSKGLVEMTGKDWIIEEWVIKPEEMFNLKNKIAVVTGAASGLGRAIALGLDAFGANIVLADINEKGLEEVSQELRNDHIVQKMDWTKLEDVKKTLKNAVKEFDHIDISFNIPGINVRKTVFEFTYDDWYRVIDINLNGMFRFAKEVGKIIYDYYKQFKGRKSGSIDFISNRASPVGIIASTRSPTPIMYVFSFSSIHLMSFSRYFLSQFTFPICMSPIGINRRGCFLSSSFITLSIIFIFFPPIVHTEQEPFSPLSISFLHHH